MFNRLVPLAVFAAALCCATAVTATPLELIVNGGFEPPLSDGWETSISGTGVGVSVQQLIDPDFDYELHLTKSGGTGFGRVMQTVPLPTLDADVAVSLLLDVTAGGGAWAAGGIQLKYLDQNDGILGETLILQRSADCPWVSSDTRHIVDGMPGSWQNVALHVDTELDNLPAVPRELVKKLGVVLFIEASDC